MKASNNHKINIKTKHKLINKIEQERYRQASNKEREEKEKLSID